ncbi:MAG TPA: DNA polymerase/3'-5' exonuclease PolX [Candidatus Acidoferrales bacterium]|nr:DNA polymerase/3'-5' exonuclease PolX [Candidatus Acidoferrales bacterium]
MHERVEDLAKDRKKLTELPGIGEGMAEHIDEILATGDYALRQKLLKKYPVTMLEVLSLQGLGPKKAAFLWKEFKAGTVEAVAKLAREQKLREVPGFGEKSEENILRAVEFFQRSTGRFRINTAERTAEQVIEYIRQLGKQIDLVTPAGSLRRGKETIGDLDFIVVPAGKSSQKKIDAICEHILKYPPIEQVLAHGENKVSFRLPNGMQVDVRVIAAESYGAALIYFTGSKEHNVALRGRANSMGYTLNEYALTTLKSGKFVAGRSEEEIYSKLKLPYIEPELREMTGEIEAAEAGKLPKLITLADIRGDLQMHTTASDGKHSIEQMAEAARELGYEYIALTDHSKAVTIANGLDEKRTLQQIKKIREAEKSSGGIRLLASSEVDILKSGALDLSDEVLAQLDVVVVSVHSYMNLDKSAMTERLLAAIENPYAQILAHPTGRLLLRRDPYDYDMEKVFDACRKNQVAVECNAYPDRLDLRDAHLRLAKQRGVNVVISTDAHATNQLTVMRYGVQTSRRGWLEKKDVLNTLPLEKLLAALRAKPS